MEKDGKEECDRSHPAPQGHEAIAEEVKAAMSTVFSKFKHELIKDALDTKAAPPVYIDGDRRIFRDANHAHIIFHGVNIVYKQDPYLPDTEHYSPNDSLTEEDIQDLENWGFNIVRLGVIWEAVERQRGVYD